MAAIQLMLLGPPLVLDGSGKEISLPGKKARALLAYLALNGSTPQSRERLATLLWGSRFDDQARQSLRQCLSRLRRVLDGYAAGTLRTEDEYVVLDATAISVDACRFQSALETGDRESLEGAAALYRDEFLAGLDIPEEAFEDWLAGERSRFRDRACKLFQKLADMQTQDGDRDAAIATTCRLLAIDPLREDAHRALMKLYADSGQRTMALRQYRECAAVLQRELGVAPDADTAALYETMKAMKTAAELDDVISLDRPSIAVMPFANLSGDADQEYFADGVTDEIINRLSRNRWLLVVSRNSSFAWKGRLVDVREIGDALGARYIVEGGVRRAGDRIRVTAQLVSSLDGKNLWAGRYDRAVADIFDLQDEVAEAIAAAIEPELGDVEREIAHRKPPGNLSAWEWYLRGSWHLYRFTPEGLAEAERLFGRAIALDPGLARAHAGLAYVFIQEAFYGDPAERQATLDAAQAAASRSVACDDRDAMSHFVLGRALSLRRRYDEATLELETALELNAGFAQAWFALGFNLAWSGRPAEALPLLEKAALLSPRDPHLWTFHHLSAMSCLILGRLDEAAAFIRKAVRPSNATYWPFVTQAAIAGMRMDSAEIAKAREALLSRRPDYSISMLRKDFFFAESPRDIEVFVEGLRRAGLPE